MFDVRKVLDQWYGVGYRCFTVLADDNNVYILRHHSEMDTWTLKLSAVDRTDALCIRLSPLSGRAPCQALQRGAIHGALPCHDNPEQK
jgi:hypothetical protein